MLDVVAQKMNEQPSASHEIVSFRRPIFNASFANLDCDLILGEHLSIRTA